MINNDMASTRKEATRTSKRKTIDQNVATITTNATLSATECNNDNGIQTMQNKESKYQMDIDSEEQVSCNN